MSYTFTLRLPDQLHERLDQLAERTHRTKSFYVRSLLEEHLAELEYLAELETYAAAIRRGDESTRPLEATVEELGLDRDELLELGRQELEL